MFHFKVSLCNLAALVYTVEETGWPTGQGVLAATYTVVFIVGPFKQGMHKLRFFFWLVGWF